MKTVKFPEINLQGMEGKDVIYELSKVCINNSPRDMQGQPTGFSPEEIRKRIKVLSIIADRTTIDTIVLEDADYEVYKDCVNAMKWAVVEQKILDFIDCVNLKYEFEPVSIEETIERTETEK
jgi:hypothetical protein